MIFLLVAALIGVLVTNWETVALEPLMNVMIVLSSVLAGSFGLALILLTIIVRMAMLPLTLRQLRSSRAMQLMQPKVQELQRKYAKDQQKLQQEVSKLYQETGVSPWGCLLPLAIQMPIWIALYQSIMRVMATTPEDLLNLSQHLYSWDIVNQAVPMSADFLWLNLASPDPYFIMPILVGGGMWVQQRMVATPSPTPQQQQMNRLMQWMMPLMFALFALQFPTGLSVYWVTMIVIGIVTQYFVTGWGGLRRQAAPATPVAPVAIPAETLEQVGENADEKPGGKRQVSRGSSRSRSQKARRKSRGSKGRRSKKR